LWLAAKAVQPKEKKIHVAPKPATLCDAASIAIIAVGMCDEDHFTLREALADCHWNLVTTNTIAEAMRFVEFHPIPVIFCERDLPDGNWRDLLAAAGRSERPPNVIVASRLADDYLWAEVLNLGGYDVLAKPLDRCEVIHALTSAWRNWPYDPVARMRISYPQH
jgi:DNA-binding NtrC family response regulator